MSLEIYQIVLIIVIGVLVGISMSFVGQTGQGIVFPMVLIITGNVLLAIAINVLNDLITASSVSITYIIKKEFKIRKDTFTLIIIAIVISFFGVLILMTTPLGSIFGWAIPLFIVCLGISFLKQGFPTNETLKPLIIKLSRKFFKKNATEEELVKWEEKMNQQLVASKNDIQGVISPHSKLYYILAMGFGIFMGINSGMFGGNSGLIIVLALIIIYGYPLKKGVGTALILSIIVSTFTFVFYQFLGFSIQQQFYFNLEISLFLGISSIITGIISSIYIQNLSAKVMGRGIGLIIIILGTISLIFYFIT